MRFIDFDPRQLRRFDFILTALVLAMMIAGLFVIWGVTGSDWNKALFARKDLWMLCAGLVFFFLCCFLDLKTIEWCSWLAYAACLLALLGLKIFGDRTNGALAWYHLGSVTIQPSEFAKIATVMVLASYLGSNREHIEHLRGFLIAGAIAAAPAIITVLENDTGTALTFGPIFLVMVFMAGVRKRILAGFFLLGFLACACALPILNKELKNYQLVRIVHVLGPSLSRPVLQVMGRDADKILSEMEDKSGSGWQSQQARVALGSGRMFGKGWGKGTQTNMRWLPSAHKDTIFASLGEQFGMTGCLLLLLGYALMVWRCARIALHARDMFCSLLVIGLATIFITHIIVNAGMNVDLLPVIGIPLPFMSYGGSFLIALSIMFGLVVNVGMRKFIY